MAKENGKDVKDFLKVIEGLQTKMKEEKQRNSIARHYGVKDDNFAKMVGECIGMLLANSNKKKSNVLDKMFPKSSAEERLKVEAYYAAKTILMNGEDK